MSHYQTRAPNKWQRGRRPKIKEKLNYPFAELHKYMCVHIGIYMQIFFFFVLVVHERQVSVDRMPLCHSGTRLGGLVNLPPPAHLNSCFCFIFVKGLNEVKTIAEEGWVCVPRCAHYVSETDAFAALTKSLFFAMDAFEQKNQTLE